MDFDRNALENMSRKQTEDYLRRSSVTYLECCVSLMLTHMDRDEVAKILEAEARLIRDFD